jgi:hypothetical protein
MQITNPVMVHVDVYCPFCQAEPGEPCRNPQGGELASGKKRSHDSRHSELNDMLEHIRTSSQGVLRAMLADRRVTIEKLELERPRTAYSTAIKERRLESARRMYDQVWLYLKPEHRPVVTRVVPSPKRESVPHPLLIDCPDPICLAKKHSACFPQRDGLAQFHILRIRQSP